MTSSFFIQQGYNQNYYYHNCGNYYYHIVLLFYLIKQYLINCAQFLFTNTYIIAAIFLSPISQNPTHFLIYIKRLKEHRAIFNGMLAIIDSGIDPLDSMVYNPNSTTNLSKIQNTNLRIKKGS